jgi:hypothetical protein
MGAGRRFPPRPASSQFVFHRSSPGRAGAAQHARQRARMGKPACRHRWRSGRVLGRTLSKDAVSICRKTSPAPASGQRTMADERTLANNGGQQWTIKGGAGARLYFALSMHPNAGTALAKHTSKRSLEMCCWARRNSPNVVRPQRREDDTRGGDTHKSLRHRLCNARISARQVFPARRGFSKARVMSLALASVSRRRIPCNQWGIAS